MVATVNHAGGDAGAARRRRKRRLRSWAKHERLSVAMALAQALHQSSAPSTKKVVERREEHQEAEYETHNAPRGQNTPPPGMLPGVLPDLEAAGAARGGGTSPAGASGARHAATRGCGWRSGRCIHPRLPHPDVPAGEEEGREEAGCGDEGGGEAASDARGGGGPRWLATRPQQRRCPVSLAPSLASSGLVASFQRLKDEEDEEEEEEKEEEVTEEVEDEGLAQLLFVMSLLTAVVSRAPWQSLGVA